MYSDVLTKFTFIKDPWVETLVAVYERSIAIIKGALCTRQ